MATEEQHLRQAAYLGAFDAMREFAIKLHKGELCYQSYGGHSCDLEDVVVVEKNKARNHFLKHDRVVLGILESISKARVILGTANEYNALLTFGAVDLELKEALEAYKKEIGGES